jgi:antitoxin VapB
MALHINNPEVEQEIRALAADTGQTLTEAVGTAVREHRRRIRARTPNPKLVAELMKIAKRAAAKRTDFRPADEIIGYDDRGLPS